MGGRQAEKCGHVYLEGSWVAQKGVLWAEFRLLTVCVARSRGCKRQALSAWRRAGGWNPMWDPGELGLW